MRGAKFQFFYFRHGISSTHKKSSIYLPRNVIGKKEKCSHFSWPRLSPFSFGTWKPPIPLRFGDEGERQPHRGHDACGITACW